MVTGYWFSDAEGHTANTREHGLPPAAVGVVHRHEGAFIPCERGLHWSPTPYDALKYADAGLFLWRVEGPDDAIAHGDPVDKYCGHEQRIVAGPMDVRPITGAAYEQARAAYEQARAAYYQAWAAYKQQAGAAYEQQAWAAINQEDFNAAAITALAALTEKPEAAE